jgi:hypothetical protein
MQNLSLIIGLIILSLVAIGLMWSIWPGVVGVLALIGLARVYWIWRERSRSL